VIETARLLLREWREGDVQLMNEHCNTPAVMRWLGDVQDPAQVEALVARQYALQADHGHCFWVVERREDGAFLGMCGLKKVDAPGGPMPGGMEIGWRFREDSWGRGYAKEAATAALDFAFGRLAARRVVAFTVEGNSASWGLMERLGMVRRPDLDFDDPRYPPDLNPTIVYVIEAAQWRA
jgi:RimJ/RimL family protein N-acetyltransferase